MAAPNEKSGLKTNLVGKRFGRLLVTEFSHSDSRRKAYWKAVCDCGGEKTVAGYNLGVSVSSCGCLQSESRLNATVTHGKRKTKTYNVWAAMVQRCTNCNSVFFHRYGARGIDVCDKWKTFQGFLDDMGERPDGMTLDRIDNNTGYRKENCRWVSRTEQARNRSSNLVIEHEGRSLPLAAWAEVLGIRYATLHARLAHGWDVARAFATPTRNSHVAL